MRWDGEGDCNCNRMLFFLFLLFLQLPLLISALCIQTQKEQRQLGTRKKSKCLSTLYRSRQRRGRGLTQLHIRAACPCPFCFLLLGKCFLVVLACYNILNIKQKWFNFKNVFEAPTRSYCVFMSAYSLTSLFFDVQNKWKSEIQAAGRIEQLFSFWNHTGVKLGSLSRKVKTFCA